MSDLPERYRDIGQPVIIGAWNRVIFVGRRTYWRSDFLQYRSR